MHLHTYCTICTYIHKYIHTYMHTYIHTYMHTYIHTYKQTAVVMALAPIQTHTIAYTYIVYIYSLCRELTRLDSQNA